MELRCWFDADAGCKGVLGSSPTLGLQALSEMGMHREVVNLVQSNSWLKQFRSTPWQELIMDHTKQKSTNPTASQLKEGERQKQISGARGGNVSCGGAKMLSGTSYLFPSRCWALSGTQQLI